MSRNEAEVLTTDGHGFTRIENGESGMNAALHPHFSTWVIIILVAISCVVGFDFRRMAL